MQTICGSVDCELHFRSEESQAVNGVASTLSPNDHTLVTLQMGLSICKMGFDA